MWSYCLVLAVVAICLVSLIAWLVCAASPPTQQTGLGNSGSGSELYTALLGFGVRS